MKTNFKQLVINNQQNQILVGDQKEYLYSMPECLSRMKDEYTKCSGSRLTMQELQSDNNYYFH